MQYWHKYCVIWQTRHKNLPQSNEIHCVTNYSHTNERRKKKPMWPKMTQPSERQWKSVCVCVNDNNNKKKTSSKQQSALNTTKHWSLIYKLYQHWQTHTSPSIQHYTMIIINIPFIQMLRSFGHSPPFLIFHFCFLSSLPDNNKWTNESVVRVYFISNCGVECQANDNLCRFRGFFSFKTLCMNCCIQFEANLCHLFRGFCTKKSSSTTEGEDAETKEHLVKYYMYFR